MLHHAPAAPRLREVSLVSFYRSARMWECRLGPVVVQWDHGLWQQGDVLPLQIWLDRF